MNERYVSRRTVCALGATALATSITGIGLGQVPAKGSNETRVVFYGGNYWHNGVVYERHCREVFGDTGWRLLFPQSSKFVTPELLETTDLFINVKEEGLDVPGFSPDGIVEKRDEPAMFMTDEQEDSIVSNVRNRGMGLFCMHSSTRHHNRPKYHELIGIEGPISHGGFNNLTVTYIHPDHPITVGIPAYKIGRDQPRHVILKEDEVTVLIRAYADRDETEDVFGWCVERDNGRVVAFLPGHDPGPWNNQYHKLIMWRAAHWALKREIPQKEFT